MIICLLCITLFVGLASLSIIKISLLLGEAIKDGVLQMRDVDRAKVYGEHLGKKLREGGQ